MTSAVVLGGGFAGVLAAKVLAGHVDDVTVLESGWYPASPGVRPGLPQAHHSHVLVTGGALALEHLLPGTLAGLLARGAQRRGLPGDSLILSSHGWFHRLDTGAFLISASRWLIDHVVREQALAGSGITVREHTRVLGLTRDASRVHGVVVSNPRGHRETIRADLVVDATGRRSRAAQWLAVEQETVDPGLAYATRVYRAPAGLTTGLPAIMLHPRAEPGRPGHGATLLPIEDDRWIVTLTGTRGAEPPGDEGGFTACARGLRSPIVADLLAAAEPLGGVRPYRATANRRRFFERRANPAGLLVLGDALVAVNPVYSHGMSVAALSALRLDRELARHGTDPTVFAGLQHAMAAEAEPSWRMATAQDPVRTGAPEPARARMSRAVLSNPALMTAMFRAQTLVPPAPAPVAPMPRELFGDTQPLLDPAEAVAQYPGLADWWLTTVGSRV